MLPSQTLRTVGVVAICAMCMSCVSTQLPPISSIGDGFEPLKDERRLWESARAEEIKLRENVALYRDPLLEDYLETVVARLNPPSMAANREIGFRLSVIEDPTLNAFAFPHGSIYVHTGLLARMENEDQLATVLGHEMSHVEDRHMVRYQRSIRNKQIGFGAASIAAALIIAGEQGDAYREGKYGKAARIGILSEIFVGLGLQLAVLASVNGYGRDLEREADAGAFDKMHAAGYDLHEAPRVYETLLDDHGESGKAEAFFFGSHPQLTNRIESANRWLAENDPGAELAPRPESAPHNPETFLRRIRPVVRDDARLNLEMGRLALARDQLQRVVGWMPEDPETHLLLGRLALKESENEQDPGRRAEMRADAAAAFREAVRLDPDRPRAHRELGLLAYRDEDFETACVQFRQYVELDPKADDAQRIRDYVLELERDDACP